MNKELTPEKNISEYSNGEKTGFIAPIKGDNTPNYFFSPINLGQQGWPPHEYE